MSRFFHTLVVFGASLPACGGSTVDTLGKGDPDPGGGGNGGTANSLGGGPSKGGARPTGTGGILPTASGGTRPTGAGGTPPAGTGGRPRGNGGSLASGGAAYDAGAPAPTTAAQWSCGGEICRYDLGNPRLILNQPCPVDPRRPRSLADCAPEQWFDCVGASYLGVGLAVNCRCRNPEVDAGALCGACVDPNRPEHFVEAISCTDREKLCGCALTSILI